MGTVNIRCPPASNRKPQTPADFQKKEDPRLLFHGALRWSQLRPVCLHSRPILFNFMGLGPTLPPICWPHPWAGTRWGPPSRHLIHIQQNPKERISTLPATVFQESRNCSQRLPAEFLLVAHWPDGMMNLLQTIPARKMRLP